MDDHILCHSHDEDYCPAKGFEMFCRANNEICKEEIKRLMNEQNMTNKQAIYEKIKKTYKNRYYIIKKKCV
jgi:hypothetical protein